MDYFPEIVSFRLTSRCTRDCDFCYGPKSIKELDFFQLKQIFSLLASKGTKSITLTGGEPLLRSDIKEVVKEIKCQGLKIFLDTNADLFFEHADIINNHVDILGLPLDDIRLNNKIFGHVNPEQVMKVLDYYRALPDQPRPKLRIGTVVTPNNVNQLADIAERIKDFPISYWKLYQFIPIGQQASVNRDKLLIDEKVFLAESAKVMSAYGKQINIIISPRRQRANAYFMINPDGQVIMPEDKDDVCCEAVIGGIFDPEIIAKWRSHIYENNYLENAEITFSHDWQSYPMPEVYNKIWRLAKRYNHQGQDYTEKHIEWLIKQSLLLAKQENIEEQIFIPFILLHDVGYSASQPDSPFASDSRKSHMQAGKQIAKKILRQVNYPKHLTNKISNYIAIHDNWAFNDHQLYRKNKILGLFNDLDFTSMYSAASFGSLMKILKKTPTQFMDYLKNNEKVINRPFASDNSRFIYSNTVRKMELTLAADAF